MLAIVRRTSSGGYALVESLSKDDEEHVEATEAPPIVKPKITEVAPVASADFELSCTRVHERMA